MAKILVERNICDACGADVRPDSLFCYNCGGAVSEDLPEPATNNDRKDDELKTTQLKKETVENFESQPIVKPIASPDGNDLFEKIESPSAEKPSIREDAKLKSAASLR